MTISKQTYGNFVVTDGFQVAIYNFHYWTLGEKPGYDLTYNEYYLPICTECLVAYSADVVLKDKWGVARSNLQIVTEQSLHCVPAFPDNFLALWLK